VSVTALDVLVASLDEVFAASKTNGRTNGCGASVTSLMSAYAATEKDWRPYALFADHGYTRNLVVRRATYELMILCWGEGQESPIHNHEDQDCWMGVLEGCIEEVRFEMPTLGQTGAPKSLGAQSFQTGQVAYIRDEMGLHLVRPAPGPAVSLHLYAAPYDECNCYCPETGKITRKRLFNYSERGQLLTQDAADVS
jgi:cysteine dioxygenase